MKLSIKALLPLAIFLLGSAKCSESNVDQTERINLKDFIEYTMNERENLIMALKHPSVMIVGSDSNSTNVSSAPNAVLSFREWGKYLHDENLKATLNKKISEDAAYKFYRLDLTAEEINSFKSYLDNNPNITDLSKFGDDTNSKEKALKDKIENQFNIKKDYLYGILENLPIINLFVNDDDHDNFHKIISSHIHEFVANALVFDYKRFNFSNLHSALESIKGAVEVPRKAKHAAEGAMRVLSDFENYDLVEKTANLDQLYIKRTKSEEKAKAKSEDDKIMRNRQINIISVALESANSSTSSPNAFFTVLSASLFLLTSLIVHNAVTVKADEDEVEGDEECGEGQ